MSARSHLLGWALRDAAILLGSVAIGGWLSFSQPPIWLAIVTAITGFFLAYINCYVWHEWGHWLGARLSGARLPLARYSSPLMGLFDVRVHSRAQWLALSWGGVAGYLTCALVCLIVWLSDAAGVLGAGLATGGAAFVVQSLAVDVPQIAKVRGGADIAATAAAGASPQMILRRTWQTWVPLALLIGAGNLMAS